MGLATFNCHRHMICFLSTEILCDIVAYSFKCLIMHSLASLIPKPSPSLTVLQVTESWARAWERGYSLATFPSPGLSQLQRHTVSDQKLDGGEDLGTRPCLQLLIASLSIFAYCKVIKNWKCKGLGRSPSLMEKEQVSSRWYAKLLSALLPNWLYVTDSENKKCVYYFSVLFCYCTVRLIMANRKY